jgi:hypothetical protein
MEDRRVQMVQLYTCTSQLETPRVQEHARTQDLATGRSGGDRSWTRAQTAEERWHTRGGSAAHTRLCARPMARSRMSLPALHGGHLDIKNPNGHYGASRLYTKNHDRHCDATKTRPPRNQTRAAWEMEWKARHRGSSRVMETLARNSNSFHHNE